MNSKKRNKKTPEKLTPEGIAASSISSLLPGIHVLSFENPDFYYREEILTFRSIER
jgi:hypothetical protein